MSVHNAIRFIRANRKCWTPLAGSTNSVVSTACHKPSILYIVFPASAACRRFVIFASCFIFIFVCLPVYAADCQQKRVDAQLRLDYVIDGDTVALANGDRLRLIGIDTPEIGYRGNPSQAGAIEARAFLRGLLNRREVYRLSYGVQKQDRHGRSLGHLFLGDGRNLQALLLSGGYATPLNIPPNIDFADCYKQQVNKAVEARRGLWKLQQYQTIAAQTLTGREKGYRIIYGKISHIGNSPSSIWLNMSKDLAIRIKRDDLRYFPELEPEALPGRFVQVRGMLYRRNSQLRLRLRHDTDLLLPGDSTKLN